MINAFANIDHNQTYGPHNLNFNGINFFSPNQRNLDSVATDSATYMPSPKYPQFESLPHRLSTFRAWPLARPGPLQLAQGGLYYTGDKDKTVCYYCGGGLSSWDPEDDPEWKHEHFYPYCELVERGKEQNANSIKISLSFSKQALHQFDPMKSAAVQSAMEYGYTPKTIKKAVNHPTILKGTKVFSETELMEMLNNIDDNEKSNNNQLDPANSRKCVKMSETGNCTDSSVSLSIISSASSAIEGKQAQVEEKKKVNAEKIIAENQLLRRKALCKICKNESSCIVFLPCGHLLCCTDCSEKTRECPMCHVFVLGTVKVFMT